MCLGRESLVRVRLDATKRCGHLEKPSKKQSYDPWKINEHLLSSFISLPVLITVA